GQAEAHRAGARVGWLAERQLAAAEHLRPRVELDVDLQPDDGFPVLARHQAFLHGAASKPIACSSAYAAPSIAFSLNAGPASWKPVGSSSLSPFGIEIAGMPASGIGTVQKSLRYIAYGSFIFAPS